MPGKASSQAADRPLVLLVSPGTSLGGKASERSLKGSKIEALHRGIRRGTVMIVEMCKSRRRQHAKENATGDLQEDPANRDRISLRRDKGPATLVGVRDSGNYRAETGQIRITTHRRTPGGTRIAKVAKREKLVIDAGARKNPGGANLHNKKRS